MAKKAGEYVDKAEAAYNAADKLPSGDPKFRKLMVASLGYGNAAELSTNPNESRALYESARDAALEALKIKPDNPRAMSAGDKYASSARSSGKESPLEKTLASVMVAGAFIFALDLLAPRITGNAVGSGNLPVDMGAGVVLLVASIAAMVFLFKPKTSKPMPHPEKSKVRKSKATKKKK